MTTHRISPAAERFKAQFGRRSSPRPRAEHEQELAEFAANCERVSRWCGIPAKRLYDFGYGTHAVAAYAAIARSFAPHEVETFYSVRAG